jgi:hypothetical protein
MVPVVFIEDRGGRALVRLPNGSKTSLGYNSLTETDARGHFIPEHGGSAVTAYCLDCEWSQREPQWCDACERLARHIQEDHTYSGRSGSPPSTAVRVVVNKRRVRWTAEP